MSFYILKKWTKESGIQCCLRVGHSERSFLKDIWAKNWRIRKIHGCRALGERDGRPRKEQVQSAEHENSLGCWRNGRRLRVLRGESEVSSLGCAGQVVWEMNTQDVVFHYKELWLYPQGNGKQGVYHDLICVSKSWFRLFSGA